MKKILLFLVALFTATTMYATEVDTIFVKSGDKVTYELNVDTDKYPVLKGQETKVTWYKGTTDNEERRGDEVTIKKLNDKSYFEAPVTESMNLYYRFKVTVTKGDLDESYTRDTVAYVHVYNTPNLTKINLNGSQWTGTKKIHEGDTLNINLETENPLDITKVALVQGEDTLMFSDKLQFSYVPDTTGKMTYDLVCINPVSTKKYSKNVDIVPTFKLKEVAYKLVTDSGKTEMINKFTESVVDIEATNHDQLMLQLKTNFSDVYAIDNEATVTYTWNKDGEPLPKGITADTDNTTAALTIVEYDKSTMDGTYNCIAKSGDTTFTVKFNLTSKWATSNESIDIASYTIYTDNNSVVVSNAVNQHILVTDIVGRVYVNKVIKHDTFRLPLPKDNIYVVRVGNKVQKVRVR